MDSGRGDYLCYLFEGSFFKSTFLYWNKIEINEIRYKNWFHSQRGKTIKNLSHFNHAPKGKKQAMQNSCIQPVQKSCIHTAELFQLIQCAHTLRYLTKKSLKPRKKTFRSFFCNNKAQNFNCWYYKLARPSKVIVKAHAERSVRVVVSYYYKLNKIF